MTQKDRHHVTKFAYPNNGTRSWRIGHATLQQRVSSLLVRLSTIMPTDEKDEEQPACIIPSASRAMHAAGTKYLIGHPCPLNFQIPTTDSPYLGGQIRLRLDHLDYIG